MKYILLGVVVAGMLIVSGFVINILFFPVNTAQKLVQTAYDAQGKVLNADNAIYNYEWFKQKYQDIQAGKVTLTNSQNALAAFEAAAGVRTSWSFEDKTEDSRLRAVELGSENYLQSLIADYNARASMATRNIFADHVLPSYMDALTFIRK